MGTLTGFVWVATAGKPLGAPAGGSAIRDRQLYGRIPGIEAPWTVIGVALALRGDRVMAHVEHSGTGRVGPDCEQHNLWARSLTNGLVRLPACSAISPGAFRPG